MHKTFRASLRFPRWPVLLNALLLVAMLQGCAHSRPGAVAVTGCEPVGNAKPICGFKNPEDLVALPGGQAILVSEFGAMEGGRPGALALLVLETEERRQLFTGGDAAGAIPSWGDPGCPGPPPQAFSPHGIHLSRRRSGALQLLAVQHGGRESIEFFEVEGSGTDWRVAWRGCVVAPGNAWLNSVAALPEGGFVTTNMMTRRTGDEDLAEAFARGEASGYALVWQPGAGFEILGGSRGSMPNGIEVSGDGRYIFLNSSGDDEVRRIARATGEVEATAQVESLDNARWASDGRLVVASIGVVDPDQFQLCQGLTSGACPIAFRIVAVDPATMETEELYRNEGAPMGGGTVGLVIGNELFVGSFAGDRILRVTLDR